MAKLASFKRDMKKARESGEWVQVGDDYGDLEILTRGFTDEYTDMRSAALHRLAVRNYRGDANKITTAESRAITIECLQAKCLLGVRNLVDDAGQPMTLDDFVRLLDDPDFSDLYTAALIACGNVGRAKAVNAGDDVKN